MKKNLYITESDKLGMLEQIKNGLPSSYLYNKNDLFLFQNFPEIKRTSLETIEDLLKRDKQREKDGFPKKIKVGKIPTESGKVIIIPSTEEEKLYHGNFEPKAGGGETGGDGEGEEGEVIGERPIDENEECGEDEGDSNGPGNTDGGEHGIDADIYEIGEKLTKEFGLPNLKDKGKKIPTDRYTHDLTDRHNRTGQFLDKKATIKQIVKTNLSLNRLDRKNPDTRKLIVRPEDKIFRVLSKEKIYESQAIVFFVRDYSGSMYGEPTRAVVSQHLMIYSWLMYQYQKLVIPRFILHDTSAKEVPNFETYYRLAIAGGTRCASAYELVNKIVFEEGLDRNYNIYVFHGTDGDDWDEDGGETIPEIEKILSYANRMGISVTRNTWSYAMSGANETTTVEKYIKSHSIVEENRSTFRIFAMNAREATENKNVEAIKHLISV